MASYAGLDVSEAKTHIYVLDEHGQVRKSAAVTTAPQTIVNWLERHAPDLRTTVLETGARAELR